MERFPSEIDHTIKSRGTGQGKLLSCLVVFTLLFCCLYVLVVFTLLFCCLYAWFGLDEGRKTDKQFFSLTEYLLSCAVLTCFDGEPVSVQEKVPDT